MPLFSQRVGIKPISKAFQYEALDQDTRNQIWSVLYSSVFEYYIPPTPFSISGSKSEKVEILAKNIWISYFKKPIDALRDPRESISEIRKIIIDGIWYEVLDLLEYIIKTYDKSTFTNFKDSINVIFERESCVYRFVELEVLEVTDKTEIDAIEKAIELMKPYSKHLSRALELLSDRKKPDYRNSIKESISAIEAICRDICKDEKATLGDALKKLKSKVLLKQYHKK